VREGAEVNDIVNVAAVVVVDAQEAEKYPTMEKPLQQALVAWGV